MAKWEEKDPRWLVTERTDGHNVNSWHWQEVNRFEWSRQRLTELLTAVSSASIQITALKSLTGEVRGGQKRFLVLYKNVGGTTSGQPALGRGLTAPSAPAPAPAQAMLTTRKQNKRFALYDLNLVLAWAEAPAAGDGGEGAADGGSVEAEAADGPAAGVAAAAPVCGEVHIKEFAAMSEEEDIEFSVNLDSKFLTNPRGAGARAAAEALRASIFEALGTYVAELNDQLS